MAENTEISWADATLNFWVGCTKVSTGGKGACEHCYAETWAKRWPQYQDTWGPGAPRVRFAHLLAKAMKLERLAIAKLARGEGAFFCFSNSLSDIFDNEVPIEWLAEAFDAMRAAPHVTFLLLTKRPQNIVKRFTETWKVLKDGEVAFDEWWPSNAAIGCTAVTQAEADRDIPWLLRAKTGLNPAFAFVSMEPLMEAVNIRRYLAPYPAETRGFTFEWDQHAHIARAAAEASGLWTGLDWVITGGESGAHARPSHPDWYRSLRDQCAAAEVAYQHKQNGEWVDEMVLSEHMPSPAEAIYLEPGPARMVKIGKKASGRLLDGVEHNDRPRIAA